MYSVDFKRDLNLLDIRWHAIFSADLVVEYAREVYACYEREGIQPGYLLRMDMTGSAVQPQDVLATFREQFSNFPRAKRIAIITPSAITRFQVKRIMTQPYLEVFATPEESMNWLLQD